MASDFVFYVYLFTYFVCFLSFFLNCGLISVYLLSKGIERKGVELGGHGGSKDVERVRNHDLIEN